MECNSLTCECCHTYETMFHTHYEKTFDSIVTKEIWQHYSNRELKAMEVLEAELFLQQVLGNVQTSIVKQEPVDEQIHFEQFSEVEFSQPSESYSPLAMSPGNNTPDMEDSPIKLSLYSQPVFDELQFNTEEADVADTEVEEDVQSEDSANNEQLQVQLSRMSFGAISSDDTIISTQASPPLYIASENNDYCSQGGYMDDYDDDLMELQEDEPKEPSKDVTSISNLESPLWCAHERGAQVVQYQIGAPVTNSPIHSRKSWLDLHLQTVNQPKKTNDITDDIQEFSTQDLMEPMGGFGQQTTDNTTSSNDWLTHLRNNPLEHPTSDKIKAKRKKTKR